MQLNWLDRIGDWNPQLFREIKGRLKVRNVALAVATSLLGQLVLFLFWLGQVPNSENTYWGEPYCRLRDTYLANQQQSRQLQGQYRQLQQQFSRYSGSEHYDPEKIQQLKGSIQEHKERIEDLQKLQWGTICPPDAIDTQLWWHDHYPKIFASLSVFVLFALLVVGTYMLISDLAREEHRGTLNFIRLSPQSPQSILSGKMLGVPILLYLAVVLTVPLHLWLGLSAQIPLVEIISFWLVLVASCAFFYSAALLFGLVSSWLGGFQAWLGSGAVLFFLWVANYKPIDDTPLDWLNLFCPSVVLPYLVDRTGSEYTPFPFSDGVIQNWEWFNLPLGATGVTVVIFVLLNYGLWTGWIWQALKRCFCNPNATILSKRQSYWLVTCFEVVILGFATRKGQGYYFGSPDIYTTPLLVGCFNLLLLLGLIAVLSPHRQALQDWARYRRESVSTRKGFWHRTLVKDLIEGENSPSLIAIAINLVIAITPFLVWILLLPTEYIEKIKGLFAVAFFISLMMIYASIFQLMLLMKTQKRSLWATGTIAALNVLLPIILGVLSIDTYTNPTLWLFSTLPWVGIENATTTTMFMALLGEWGVLVLLNLQLTRQLRRAGESASKALFARSPVH
jgi:hypothetical protein